MQGIVKYDQIKGRSLALIHGDKLQKCAKCVCGVLT
jgi:hypothetical protein